MAISHCVIVSSTHCEHAHTLQIKALLRIPNHYDSEFKNVFVNQINEEAPRYALGLRIAPKGEHSLRERERVSIVSKWKTFD